MPPSTSHSSTSQVSTATTDDVTSVIEEIKISKKEDGDDKEEKEGLSKTSIYHTEADRYRGTTQVARTLVITFVALCVVYNNSIQYYVDNLWACLRENQLFRSAYFETVYVTGMYAVIIATYPFAMHYIPFLQKFKVANDVTYIHQSVIGILVNAVVYMVPLLAADAVIMKRYWEVPEHEWVERRKQWIQTTRALPAEAPPFLLMCLQVAASIFVFDILFFCVHYALHKNLFLFKHIHAIHHDHEVMHAHVTNQLSITERLLLIASANYALKLFMCHPLTRILFVPMFEWFLVENHTGYDLPWGPHRLVPQGWMGGPAKHHAHHVHSTRHYQPFFNYLDNWLEKSQMANKKRL